MSQKAAADTVREWWSSWQAERDRLDDIDNWYRTVQETPRLPPTATREVRHLADLSRTPWLGLVVTTVAQCMYVDGYRSSTGDPAAEADGPTGPWRTWHANGLSRGQVPIHRAALGYGYSFETVLPGRDWRGDPMSVMRGVSPRKMWATYGDVATDDWPIHAFEVRTQPDRNHLVRLYDEEAVYYLAVEQAGGKAEYVSHEVHGAGVTPVVRFVNQLDLDGRCDGEVEPFIPAAKRINKTAFDRLLVQHFDSWKVRTATGMTKPEDDEAANAQALELAISDMLMAEDPNARFGTLDETSLDGFISAWRSDIEALAAVTQTPTHELTGQMANLSAEALAAARASLTQKVAERQMTFGQSHVQALRLAAALEGDHTHAEDVFSRVTWQDTEIRSLSQAVDALGKAAQLLGIPVRALWGRIPGVEKADVDDWTRMADAADPVTRFAALREQQAAPATPATPPNL